MILLYSIRGLAAAFILAGFRLLNTLAQEGYSSPMDLWRALLAVFLGACFWLLTVERFE